MAHPLHLAVGNILRILETPEILVLLDEACGGNRGTEVYGAEKVCLAYVDAAIAVDGEIKVVLEIEESNDRPVALCGKVTAVAMSKWCIHGGIKYSLSQSLFFVQMFLEKPGKERSKHAQCLYLEAEIP